MDEPKEEVKEEGGLADDDDESGRRCEIQRPGGERHPHFEAPVGDARSIVL